MASLSGAERGSMVHQASTQSAYAPFLLLSGKGDRFMSIVTQSLVLGGGCFWCTESVFLQVRGLTQVESGYSNGQAPNPSYEMVCTGNSGYNEVVRLEFDPDAISLQEILEIFFLIHDPTTLNRQGHDVGTQYRSGIYCTTQEQLQAAQAIVQSLEDSGDFGKPVVTEVQMLSNYARAEEYHQNFFAKNPGQGYCLAVAAPKVAKFRKTFARLAKA
jgi:peptide-methionine (S)-S-oxide reductase